MTTFLNFLFLCRIFVSNKKLFYIEKSLVDVNLKRFWKFLFLYPTESDKIGPLAPFSN